LAERTILASFYSEAEAKQAANEIQALGVEVAQVDELHAYSPIEPNRDAFLISGKIPSLASITLNTVPDSRDSGALLAADPSASGMADGEGNVTGRNYLLTAICPENLVDTAVRVIRACNGYT
jgi:hypothetical protein